MIALLARLKIYDTLFIWFVLGAVRILSGEDLNFWLDLFCIFVAVVALDVHTAVRVKRAQEEMRRESIERAHAALRGGGSLQ